MSTDGFLSRWSRRKRAAGTEAEPGAADESAAPAAAAPPAEDAPPDAADTPEPAFDLASLPSIDTLTAESDITVFLHKAVPESLRRAALRRAWLLDPAIRDFVGMADYAWDFNAPDGATGFSLEIGGDAVKLLAHAMGLDAAAPTDPPGNAPSVAPTAPAPAAIGQTIETPAAQLVAIPQEDEAAPATADAPMLHRRHGTAVPG